MSTGPPGYEEVVRRNGRPKTLSSRISLLIPAPPSYESLFGSRATAPAPPPEVALPEAVPAPPSNSQPGTIPAPPPNSQPHTIPAPPPNSLPSNRLAPIPNSQPNTKVAPLPNPEPITRPSPVELEAGTQSTAEPEESTEGSTDKPESSDDGCEEACKNFYIIFFGAAFCLTIPTSIALIVIAQTDGPNNKDGFTTTTMFAPTTPYPSYEPATIDYEELSRCPAAQTLISYMTASGGLALAASILMILNAVLENKKDADKNSSTPVVLIALLVFAMFGMYFAGCSAVFPLWLNRPSGCSPFDEVGCPRWYCDNRLMAFALIFYSASLAFLSPLWLIIVFCIFYMMCRTMCGKTCE